MSVSGLDSDQGPARYRWTVPGEVVDVKGYMVISERDGEYGWSRVYPERLRAEQQLELLRDEWGERFVEDTEEDDPDVLAYHDGPTARLIPVEVAEPVTLDAGARVKVR